jgi:hypothetical protein
MSISMPDSVTPADLPAGYPAYLAYCDGQWATEAQVRAAHPGAHVLTLTVTGLTLGADGIDCEPGNVNAAEAADWVRRKLAVAPSSRPVVYASMEGDPGYGMPWVIAALLRLGISRGQYRVHTAHYTGHPHVCSPQSCEAGGQPIGYTADGTQWASAFPGLNGSVIDMSLLADDYFGGWILSAPRSLTVTGAGPHSVRLSWLAPLPGPQPVDHYQLTVRHAGQDVPSYPRTVPPGAGPLTWQGGSLTPGTLYEALLRAVAPGGGHASPWAAVTFTTPAG